MPKPIIKQLVIEGDSLSDRGTATDRKIAGIIPMGPLAGIKDGATHAGRFSDDLVWGDFLAMELANKALCIALQDKLNCATPDEVALKITEIQDKVDSFQPLTKAEHEAFDIFNSGFTLKDTREVSLTGKAFMRSYAEGGATANDYTTNAVEPVGLKNAFTNEVSRGIMSHLSAKTDSLLKDDEAAGRTAEEKASTLITEWTGANDLITVNVEPSIDAANAAIQARINNIVRLAKNGYKNFVLCNMPDLALTPRYVSEKLQADRDKATKICNYFNQELNRQLQTLKASRKLPAYCNIDIFDVGTEFTNIHYAAKEGEYGFEASKLSTSYTECPEFANQGLDLDPTPYMFWNGVHPSSKTHRILESKLHNFIQERYDVKPTVDLGHAITNSAVEEFRSIYKQELTADKQGVFGVFKHSNLNIDLTAPMQDQLAQILHHAINHKAAFGKDNRSMGIAKRLGWLNDEGTLNVDNPKVNDAIKHAYNKVTPAHLQFFMGIYRDSMKELSSGLHIVPISQTLNVSIINQFETPIEKLQYIFEEALYKPDSVAFRSLIQSDWLNEKALLNTEVELPDQVVEAFNQAQTTVQTQTKAKWESKGYNPNQEEQDVQVSAVLTTHEDIMSLTKSTLDQIHELTFKGEVEAIPKIVEGYISILDSVEDQSLVVSFKSSDRKFQSIVDAKAEIVEQLTIDGAGNSANDTDLADTPTQEIKPGLSNQ